MNVEMVTVQQLADVLDSLRIDPARALDELESEWTTSMELAETLQRTHAIPFRVGHDFASDVVVYAMERNIRPKDFPYAEAVRIHREAGKKYDIKDQRLPLTEDHPLSATNPYGRSKLIIEDMLRDVYRVKADLRIAILRYFNPVGAHESGLIGENPLGIPSNLMPFVAQVAVGRREYLNVWGNDYATHDGTGVRDYIHVVDLALGHLKALERLDLPQCTEVNLGTGNGYSVLEVVKAFENASGQCVPYRISQRRPGDVAACYADPSHAERYLGWKAERDLAAMCRDHWNWQKQNPQGYV